MHKNEECFIGIPSCGTVFSSAKIVFLAAPADDKYKLNITVISNILEKHGYECYVALRNYNPGNFVFCTKICSKIIQSQFCIVLLEPTFNDNCSFPNPNVHFEYGMMLALKKQIIPLQDENQELSFNISPLDTTKYNDGNFEEKVSEAIEIVINKQDIITNPSLYDPGQYLYNYYGIQSFFYSDLSEPFYKSLYQFGASYGFNLLNNDNGMNYIFSGKFEDVDPKSIVLKTKLLTKSIVSRYEHYKKTSDPTKFHLNYDYLISSVGIDILVSHEINKSELLEKINENINQNYKDKVNIFYRQDIIEFIENELNKIGDINSSRKFLEQKK